MEKKILLSVKGQLVYLTGDNMEQLKVLATFFQRLNKTFRLSDLDDTEQFLIDFNEALPQGFTLEEYRDNAVFLEIE